MLRRIRDLFSDVARQADLVLLALCSATSLFGILMIYSATRYMHTSRLVLVQAASLVIGVVLYLLMSQIDLNELVKYWKWIFLLGFGFVLLLATPLGIEGGTGNRAWLEVPFLPVKVQPAEIVKVTFIIVLAKQLAWLKEHRDLKSVGSMVLLALHFGVLFLTYYKISADMGSALVFLFIFACMCFVAGVALWWFIIGGGAAGCLTARTPDALLPGKFYIQVSDTRLALKALASWYRGKFDLPVVQVTGSAGKTTTKEMIACVLGRHFCTLKTQANFNNDIGTPLTLLELAPEHQAAVIETGMNHFGEIRYLGEMVRPDIAVITNVGDAHIENLGNTRQGILRAKCEIFENLAPDGVAVLNGDDPLLNTIALPQRILRCGTGEGCDVRVTEVDDRGLEGVACTVTTAKASYWLETSAPGGYMIYPLAMAAAIGEYLGLTAEEITAGAADYVPVGSRMHLIPMDGQRLIIDDCYNANPQAMAEALRMLAKSRHRRKVAVVGDMGELGELTEQAHRDVGALARELKLDAVVAVGEKMRALRETDPSALWFPDTASALPALPDLFVGDTAVMVKASHAMHFESIVKELEKL